MSLWSPIANVICTDCLSREIDEELQSHVDEAIEQGRDPAEARESLGSALRLRDESRDILATLALFFAVVALPLAPRPEMSHGISPPGVFSTLGAGALAGIGLGRASSRYIESLLYEVKATDVSALAIPSLAILGAALPAVIGAVRIDPVQMLRIE